MRYIYTLLILVTLFAGCGYKKKPVYVNSDIKKEEIK